MILQHDRDISWVEYVAPPKPVDPTDEMIIIPEKEGVPVVVIQYESGITDYLYRVAWDLDAGNRYVAAITEWMRDAKYYDEYALGLPNAARQDILFWIPKLTLQTLNHIRTDTIVSPKAQSQSGGKSIAVPMGDGLLEIPVHGQGKRKR